MIESLARCMGKRNVVCYTHTRLTDWNGFNDGDMVVLMSSRVRRVWVYVFFMVCGLILD